MPQAPRWQARQAGCANRIARFTLPSGNGAANAVRQLRAVHGKMERPSITAQPARRPVPAVQGNAAVAGEWTEF